MGSYVFANQYMNEIVPDDERKFKEAWLKPYVELPKKHYNFGFIDPALGQKKKNDYTAVVVVSVDQDANWYVRVANRYKITATKILEKAFEVCEQFQLKGLGIESQAFQEALLHFASEEMRKRQEVYPITGIKRSGDDNKIMRIQSLVPRFEWGRMFVPAGLTDFEDEYKLFPRASHDDLLDALQSIEQIVFYPEKDKPSDKPPSPNSPEYEGWYIRQLQTGGSRNED